MNKKEIIKMAMDIDGHMNDHAMGIDLTWDTLVEIVQTAIAHEREACAKVCEELDLFQGYGDAFAAAIRARS